MAGGQQQSTSRPAFADDGDYTRCTSDSQPPSLETQNIVFRIVFGRMTKRTWMGDLHVKDLDFMMQTYRILPNLPSESNADKKKRVAVLPAQAELSGAAWFLCCIWCGHC